MQIYKQSISKKILFITYRPILEAGNDKMTTKLLRKVTKLEMMHEMNEKKFLVNRQIEFIHNPKAFLHQIIRLMDNPAEMRKEFPKKRFWRQILFFSFFFNFSGWLWNLRLRF